MFFRANDRWLEATLPVGARRVVSGKVESFDGLLQIVHPDHILPPAEAARIPDFEPVYHLTSGVTQRLMMKAVGEVLSRVPPLSEWIEPELKAREHWPDWHDAIRAAHSPESAAIAPRARRNWRSAIRCAAVWLMTSCWRIS